MTELQNKTMVDYFSERIDECNRAINAYKKILSDNAQRGNTELSVLQTAIENITIWETRKYVYLNVKNKIKEIYIDKVY
jgi:hypothetical protein